MQREDFSGNACGSKREPEQKSPITVIDYELGKSHGLEPP